MNCKNCENLFKEAVDYCPKCGAKVIRNRITLRNLFEDFAEQFLNYDNKLLKTFFHLFYKPEVVIGGYINGVRKRYVNVLSYFAIAVTISGLQFYIFNKFYPELLDFSAMAVNENAERMQETIFKNVQEFHTITMFLYIPIYALMAKIVFWRNKTFNYMELWVMFMYILSHLSIIGAFIVLVGALFGMPVGYLGVILTPIQFLYSAFCLKRLYKLDLFQIIVKSLIFFVVGFFFIIFAVILVYGFIFLTEGKEGLLEFIESQRPT